MDWLLYGICGVSALLTLIVSLRSGKGIRYFAISSACGVALLLVLTAFGRKVGVTVSLNPTTLLLSLTGGVPGTVFAAALRYFL